MITAGPNSFNDCAQVWDVETGGVVGVRCGLWFVVVPSLSQAGGWAGGSARGPPMSAGGEAGSSDLSPEAAGWVTSGDTPSQRASEQAGHEGVKYGNGSMHSNTGLRVGLG